MLMRCGMEAITAKLEGRLAISYRKPMHHVFVLNQTLRLESPTAAPPGFLEKRRLE